MDLMADVGNERSRGDQRAPLGGDTRHIFGTDLAATSPRFMRGAISRRIASRRAFSTSSRLELLGRLVTTKPESQLRANATSGHAVVDTGHRQTSHVVLRVAGRQ